MICTSDVPRWPIENRIPYFHEAGQDEQARLVFSNPFSAGWRKEVVSNPNGNVTPLKRQMVDGGNSPWTIASGQARPVTWVLVDDRPGNSTQSMGLIEALGWPYELKTLRFHTSCTSKNWYLPPMIHHVDQEKSSLLCAPWPDLIITAGQRTAPVAKWIKRQHQGKTRIVQLGRKGGLVMDELDLVVTPRYCQLPPHPNRLVTTFSLNRITTEKLEKAASEGSPVMDVVKRPRLVCLIGGATPRYQFDESVARQMGADFVRMAKETGGELVVLTSRRTGQGVTNILESQLAGIGQVFPWNPQQALLPYVTALALADVIVVTGESEAMLAEVAATDKVMVIYPLPRKSRTLLHVINPAGYIKSWLLRHSHLQDLDAGSSLSRGQVLQDICTWFFARGYCQPPRRLELLHQDLLALGIAQWFGEPLNAHGRKPFNETARVAAYIRALFGGLPQEESKESDS